MTLFDQAQVHDGAGMHVRAHNAYRQRRPLAVNQASILKMHNELVRRASAAACAQAASFLESVPGEYRQKLRGEQPLHHSAAAAQHSGNVQTPLDTLYMRCMAVHAERGPPAKPANVHIRNLAYRPLATGVDSVCGNAGVAQP